MVRLLRRAGGHGRRSSRILRRATGLGFDASEIAERLLGCHAQTPLQGAQILEDLEFTAVEVGVALKDVCCSRRRASSTRRVTIGGAHSERPRSARG
jgi:hypothetical protein